MSEQVFIRLRGRIQGPYNPDQLQSLARRGQFSRSHEVSADGVHWARATTRPELFPPAKGEGPSEFLTMLDEASVADKPPVVTPPPTNVWHYHQLGKTHGPVDFTHLQYLVSSGQVLVDDMVWQEGLPEWLPAGRVPGLVKANVGQVAATPTPMFVSPWPGHTEFQYPKVSALAVASLVLGLLWIGGLGSLLALIFGAVALYQIRVSKGRVAGTGLAVAGIVLGIVAMSLMVVYWTAMNLEAISDSERSSNQESRTLAYWRNAMQTTPRVTTDSPSALVVTECRRAANDIERFSTVGVDEEAVRCCLRIASLYRSYAAATERNNSLATGAVVLLRILNGDPFGPAVELFQEDAELQKQIQETVRDTNATRAILENQYEIEFPAFSLDL